MIALPDLAAPDDHRHKNKCGPGQPPKPHCCRGHSGCRLSPQRKIIAQLHSVERPPRCSPEACASAFRFSASILLEGGLLRRPRSPGTGALDMRRISPGDSLSRKPPATLNPSRNRFRTSHAFDCDHFAAPLKLTQPQIAPPLCKNCGARKLPVEAKGKLSFYSHRDPAVQ